jgi:hypothetical protein
MKLRFQSNSIRLRLKKSEVARLAETGTIEEQIRFGTGKEDVLIYRLEAVASELAPHARREGGLILVQVSAHAVKRWAEGDQIEIEEHQPVSDEHCLHILIEKDFACLDGSDEQNVDTFENPLAGTKC